MIRVVVVDDHPAMCEGLSTLLGAQDDISVVGQAATAEEALPLLDRVSPDVVILDVRLPGMDGLDACRVIVERYPRVRVSLVTGLRDEHTMMKAFGAGAKAFVTKEATPDTIRQSVRIAASGGTFIDPFLAGKVLKSASRSRKTEGRYGLTYQERRVLELLPGGLTNKQIASALDLSPNTVKTHLRNAMRKLQVTHRTQAAAFVEREGMV